MGRLKLKENKREVVSERDSQEFLANGMQLKRRNCWNRAEELAFQRAAAGRAWGGAWAELEALQKQDNLTLKPEMFQTWQRQGHQGWGWKTKGLVDSLYGLSRPGHPPTVG